MEKTLDKVLAEIEKLYGKGAVIKMDERQPFTFTKTGSISLDCAIGGGYPKGKIVEIYGEEACGKTGLALNAIAEAQREGLKCVYIDAEHALDPAYAELVGVNLGDLLLSQPEYGEQGFEIARHLIRSGEIGMIVVDSVSALIPKAELEGETGEAKMALQARMMSQAMRQLIGDMNKSNCTVIFINQLRDKLGGYVPSKTTTGGNALKFYSAVRLEVKKGTLIKDGDNVLGYKSTVRVVKNKVAPPFKVAEFDVIYGVGIDKNKELLDVAIKLDIITKKGSWLNYGEVKLGQGFDNASKILNDNLELIQEISKKVEELL